MPSQPVRAFLLRLVDWLFPPRSFTGPVVYVSKDTDAVIEAFRRGELSNGEGLDGDDTQPYKVER